MTPDAPEDRIEITRSPIPQAEIAKEVRGDGDGAVATFDGCVRNHSRGRTTLYLEYEAYETMALAKMREIAAALHQNHRIHRVAMVHRLGRLGIGETSVFLAVSAAHRAAACNASREASDTL